MENINRILGKIVKFTDRTDEEEEMQIDKDPVKDLLEKKLKFLMAQNDFYCFSGESDEVKPPERKPNPLPEQSAMPSEDPLLMMLEDPYGMKSTSSHLEPGLSAEFAVREADILRKQPVRHDIVEEPLEEAGEVMVEEESGELTDVPSGPAAVRPQSGPDTRPASGSPAAKSLEAAPSSISGESTSSPAGSQPDKKGSISDLLDVFRHEEKEDKSSLTENLDSVDISTLMNEAREILGMIRKRRGL